MKILNLGCGTKTCDKPEVINIDYSIALRVRRSALVRTMAPLFFRGERLNRFRTLPNNVLVHNLARGIPFEGNSVDAVYHSHLFEHLDRDVAEAFLLEVRRVLKPGGIHRIVVPDLEVICSAYMSHIRRCEEHPEECENHDAFVAPMIEQAVRRESYGTSQQSPGGPNCNALQQCHHAGRLRDPSGAIHQQHERVMHQVDAVCEVAHWMQQAQ